MLIHAEGLNRGNAPVQVYHVEQASGCILVGDARTRILLTPEEIRDLHELLEPFARNPEREAPGRVVIPEPQRALLLRMPSYTPLLLGLERRNETALTMRVEDLASFRKPELPIQVGFVLYRSEAGMWLVCVPFRIIDKPEDPLEGDAYINPRQASDYALLENLARQNIFPVVLLSPDLKDAVVKGIPWRLQGEATNALGAVDASVAGKLGGNWDPDFERAKREFQGRFTVRELLNAAPEKGG
ncbi:MAG: hypothetical protein HYY46_05535 [Deltaproteobacteria bacterium]|nr:hypothetical protein [Deltaproteobacteria bacterium]